MFLLLRGREFLCQKSGTVAGSFEQELEAECNTHHIRLMVQRAERIGKI